MFGCKLNIKQRLLFNAENQLNHSFNIKNVMRKIQNIDKLKSLILNPIQNIVFDSSKKNFITLENEEKCHGENILNEELKSLFKNKTGGIPRKKARKITQNKIISEYFENYHKNQNPTELDLKLNEILKIHQLK